MTLGLGFKIWGRVFENGEKHALGVDFSFWGTYHLTYLLSNKHYFFFRRKGKEVNYMRSI